MTDSIRSIRRSNAIHAVKLLSILVIGVCSASYGHAATTKDLTIACLTPAYLEAFHEALVKDVDLGGGNRSNAMLNGPCIITKEGLYTEVLRELNGSDGLPMVEVRFWAKNKRVARSFYTYPYYLID